MGSWLNVSKAKTRVLVVDDSAVIRQIICDRIAAAADMEVVGVADNGRQAVEIFQSAAPDLVTLDIQMPDMDGLATLDAILQRRPVPVIMVSSLTQRGAGVTLDALDRGAMDYVAKPERGAQVDATLGEELLHKIRCFGRADVKRILEIRERRKQSPKPAGQRRHVPPREPTPTAADLSDKCVAIGISTGGPPALSRLLGALRAPLPPIVIVQHMPPHFTGPLAWRLDSLSALLVKEAAEGDVLHPNQVFIAPGGKHLELRRHGNSARIVLGEGEPVSGHRPSVDVMMTSAAALYGPRLLGMIMTGMGRDGVAGCRAIRAAGGFVLGQDEASSDVYGMNKIAFVEGHVDRQFSLDEAAEALTRHVARLSHGRTRRLVAVGK